MSYSAEFEIVDLIRNSSSETRGIDAFSLSLIKTERQMRRLFTYLIYQFPCFGAADIYSLRETLGGNDKVYFKGVERGFNALYPRSIENLIGPSYPHLCARIKDATDYRNKIFHGQLTMKYLSRDDLFKFVDDIRLWCKTLATAALSEIGYDGFARNSFQKSPNLELSKHFKVQFGCVDDYAKFIREYIERYRKKCNLLTSTES